MSHNNGTMVVRNFDSDKEDSISFPAGRVEVIAAASRMQALEMASFLASNGSRNAVCMQFGHQLYLINGETYYTDQSVLFVPEGVVTLDLFDAKPMSVPEFSVLYRDKPGVKVSMQAVQSFNDVLALILDSVGT